MFQIQLDNFYILFYLRHHLNHGRQMPFLFKEKKNILRCDRDGGISSLTHVGFPCNLPSSQVVY